MLDKEGLNNKKKELEEKLKEIGDRLALTVRKRDETINSFNLEINRLNNEGYNIQGRIDQLNELLKEDIK